MQVHLHDYETSGEVEIPIGIFKKFQGHLVCSILVSRQDAIRILDGFCSHMLLLTGKVYISQQMRCNKNS